MVINADITIYSQVYNSVTGLDEYVRRVIKGVRWYSDHKTSVGTTGLVSADIYKVRIPAEKLTGYVLPQEYTGADGTWTIRKGDTIVKGIVLPDVDPTTLESTYSEVMTVTSYADLRNGGLKHIKLEGE